MPHCHTTTTVRRGLTLVELLATIAIVGLLIALLLPAVQAARESARMLQCRNNLRQIGIAATQHVASHGHFPTGGWGYSWNGDPDRGVNHRQPGGWIFNILPYIEHSTLYSLQSGQEGAARSAAGAKVVTTPLQSFQCPSRRPAANYPHWGCVYKVSQWVPAVAKSDYAANGGDRWFEPHFVVTGMPGEGPATTPSDGELAESVRNVNADPARQPTGIVFVLSALVPAAVRDGLSMTLLAGEKNLNPDWYTTGQSGGDNETMYGGVNAENVRLANTGSVPMQDRRGIDLSYTFGGPHAGAWATVRCDGSVQMISYDIDPQIPSRLANRRDGQVIDMSGL